MNQLAEGSATKLCSLCLVEAEAIAKEKRLEGEARKLKKEVIEKEKRLERDARKLKKEASNQGNGECFIDDCKEPKFFCGKKKARTAKNTVTETLDAVGATSRELRKVVVRYFARIVMK